MKHVHVSYFNIKGTMRKSMVDLRFKDTSILYYGVLQYIDITSSIQSIHAIEIVSFSFHLAREEGFIKLWEGLPPAVVRHVSKSPYYFIYLIL